MYFYKYIYSAESWHNDTQLGGAKKEKVRRNPLQLLRSHSAKMQSANWLLGVTEHDYSMKNDIKDIQYTLTDCRPPLDRIARLGNRACIYTHPL